MDKIKQLQKENNYLRKLWEASNDLIETITNNPPDILNIILKDIRKIIKYDMGAIFLFDEKKEFLRVAAEIGYDPKTKKLQYKKEDGLVGYVSTTGKTINVSNLRKKIKWEKRKPKYIGVGIYKKGVSFLLAPFATADKIIGVWELISKKENFFKKEDLFYLSSLARYSAAITKTVNLQETLKEQYREIIQTYILDIEKIDPETRKHLDRVAKYVKLITLKLKLKKNERDEMSIAARLHDVGKREVSEILFSPNKLSLEKRKEHLLETVRILNRHSFLKPIIPIVKHHHERYDGNGYPDGLKGKNIPLGSRIITVVDAFDAMTHDRSYKKAISKEEGIKELKKESGKQFDLKIVKVFLKILEREK